MIWLILLALTIALGVYVTQQGLPVVNESFGENSVKSEYTRLQNEAVQIRSAVEYYRSENSSEPPPDMQALVDEGYLKTKLPGLASVVEVGGTQYSADWAFGMDDYVTQMIDGAEKCAAINGVAGGSDQVADIPSCGDPYDEEMPCCTAL